MRSERVPAETMVVPEWELPPVSANSPAPALVKLPLPAAAPPLRVSVVNIPTEIVLVVPFVRVKLRSVEALVPV